MAFARGMPWAKRWARETDFASLPERKKRQKACTCKDSGSRSEAPQKAPAAAPKPPAGKGAPGEKLAPGITRIRANLCNVHGRYGPCDKALSGGKGKKPAKGKAPKSPKAPKAAKPKLTPEQRAAQRAAEQAQKRQANHDAVRQAMADQDKGIAPAGFDNLLALGGGKEPDAQGADSLTQMGLAVRGRDGVLRLTAAGRGAISAADRGDAKGAIDAISAAGDAMATQAERTRSAQERTAARAARQQETVRRRADVQKRRSERMRKRASVRKKRTPPVEPVPPLAAAPPAEAKEHRVTEKAAWDTATINNLPDGAFLFIEAGGKKDADGKTVPRSKRHFPYKDSSGKIDLPHLRNALARIPQSSAPGLNKAAVTKRAQSLLAGANKDDSGGTFTVYKDSAGADRWLAITTTAYEDKDREIISTNAIKEAVMLGDATQDRGPLLYWHVPGLALGDCDFQAQGGPGDRFLIEGGTFRSKALAAFGQKLSSSGYQMSPGFIHGDDQPRDGVYDHILIYERSAVPPGRAANYFTRLAAAKETSVVTPEKIAEYREKASGNAEALALLDTLLTTAQKEDEAAQAKNVVYKDAPGWAQALIARLDGLETTVKAMGGGDMAGSDMAEETPAEDTAESGVEEPADAGMDDAAFAQMIAQAVVQAITPLLDIEKKMAGHMADLKSTLGGYAQTKDDAQAAQAKQIEALSAKVDELTGDLPTSVMNGARTLYRASESPTTQLTPQAAATVKEQLANVPAGLSDPAEISAYQLIFGNS